MANYYGKTRTNYFRVTDEEALHNLIENRCAGREDNLHLYSETDENGITYFKFYCESTIEGLRSDEYEDEYSYDAFIDELQKLLPENEAVIITEIGNEKMRYLHGSVIVVTQKETKYRDLDSVGKALAKKLLGNLNWKTKNEY